MRSCASWRRPSWPKEKPGQTLQATALVHEAYLRLVDVAKVQRWDSRGHFFAAAAEAMRRILLNRARDKKRAKRGGERRRIDLDQIEIALDTDDEELIALDDALTRLAGEDPDAARLVNLQLFAGLTLRDDAMRLPWAIAALRRAISGALCSTWLYSRLPVRSPVQSRLKLPEFLWRVSPETGH